MKKVSLTDIKKARKWIIPGGIVALGLVAIAAAQTGPGSSKAAVTEVPADGTQSQSTVTPAPTVKADVTVNGQKVPTDKDGTTSMNVPGGKAHVEVSGGHTRITTSDTAQSGDTSNKQSTSVNIQTNSNGGGTSSTQVFGSTHTSTVHGTSDVNDNGPQYQYDVNDLND